MNEWRKNSIVTGNFSPDPSGCDLPVYQCFATKIDNILLKYQKFKTPYLMNPPGGVLLLSSSNDCELGTAGVIVTVGDARVDTADTGDAI